MVTKPNSDPCPDRDFKVLCFRYTGLFKHSLHRKIWILKIA